MLLFKLHAYPETVSGGLVGRAAVAFARVSTFYQRSNVALTWEASAWFIENRPRWFAGLCRLASDSTNCLNVPTAYIILKIIW